MKISIITVSFNAVKTIEQTISSVINQDNYNEIEYIIIDGGSTDGTVDVIKKYEDEIAYWISEPDAGIYDAMNKGIAVSTGDYIQIIGSDDCLIDYSIISKVIMDIENTDSVDIFSAGILVVDEQFKCERYAGNESARNKSNQMPWLPHAGAFVKKELLKSITFDVKYRIAADLKFLLMCYYNRSVRFKYVEYPVARFSSSGVSSKNILLAREENRQIFNELGLNNEKYANTNSSIVMKLRLNVVCLLRELHILGFIKTHLLNWKKHNCNNKICRWCNRSM